MNKRLVRELGTDTDTKLWAKGIDPATVRAITYGDGYMDVEYYRYNSAYDALAGRNMGETVVVRLSR